MLSWHMMLIYCSLATKMQNSENRPYVIKINGGNIFHHIQMLDYTLKKWSSNNSIKLQYRMSSH